jgi:hypothetical protein
MTCRYDIYAAKLCLVSFKDHEIPFFLKNASKIINTDIKNSGKPE